MTDLEKYMQWVPEVKSIALSQMNGTEKATMHQSVL